MQNIPAFAEFLHVAALTNAEILNYTNVSRECGVSAKVVRNYFQILEDTLLGFRLEPWKKTRDRRLIETEKFYFFDVGVANYLARRQPQFKTPEFGKAFEHFIAMELFAYQAYKNPELKITFWRTASGMEVDFILNDMEVAIEIKTSSRISEADVRTLKILQEENKVKKCILVSFETEPRVLAKNIHCFPWEIFLKQLWDGEIISF